jgi:hypothetical protein
VGFSWPAISGATSYSISSQGSGFAPVQTAQTATSYSQTTSVLGDMVKLIVTPMGQGCYAPGTLTCLGANCPSIDVVVPANVSSCAGALLPGSNFSSTEPGTTFSWSSDNNLIGLPTSGAGNVPAFLLQNPTANPIHATITVAPVFGQCKGTPKSYTIDVFPRIAITNAPQSTFVCIGSNASFNVGAKGNIASYQWQVRAGGGSTFSNLTNTAIYNGTNTSTLAVNGASLAFNNIQYRVLLFDQCSLADSSNPVTLSVGMCSVWPGDADNNLIANMYDLFPIGLNYGKTGPARVVTGTLWQAYPASDWTVAQANGFNLKHADCTGNGIIDLNDVQIIKNHYGLVHNKTEATFEFNAANPDLYFIVPGGNFPAGSIVNAEIWAGKSNVMATSMAGLCFRAGFDGNLIEPGSVKLTFNKSWLADPALNAINLDTVFSSNSFVDGAIVRTDGANQSGYGKIAGLQMKIKAGVANGSMLNLSFKEYSAINASNMAVVLNPINASIVTGLQSYNSLDSFVLSPNPSSGAFIMSSHGNPGEGVEIFVTNIQGQEVFRSANKFSEQILIDLSGQSKGIYFMHMQNGNGAAFRKLILQ